MNRGDIMKAQYELKGKSPRRQKIERTILFIMLLIFALFCFTPFYIMIINSTQSNADLASKLSLIPGKEFVNNYNRLGDRVNIWVGFKNSIFISTLATIFAAYFGALTAYGFSKFNFKGKFKHSRLYNHRAFIQCRLKS